MITEDDWESIWSDDLKPIKPQSKMDNKPPKHTLMELVDTLCDEGIEYFVTGSRMWGLGVDRFLPNNPRMRDVDISSDLDICVKAEYFGKLFKFVDTETFNPDKPDYKVYGDLKTCSGNIIKVNFIVKTADYNRWKYATIMMAELMESMDVDLTARATRHRIFELFREQADYLCERKLLIIHSDLSEQSNTIIKQVDER